MSASNTITVSLSLSEDEKTATIRLSTRRQPIVCGCLGVERDKEGHTSKVYLDSLIHSSSKHVEYRGFSLHGAISTVVKRV
jgi:hypothetical protein